MALTFEGLIDNDSVDHTRFTLDGEDKLSFYVDNKIGTEILDRYHLDQNGSTIYLDTITTINVGHDKEKHNFIRNTLNKLDEIIDLDFFEMDHNNGSMLDIYHISYSSHFQENVIGQAMQQQTKEGGWWDIFWKDSPLSGEINLNSDKNTIIHEIGHSLGLSHPLNDPKNKLWTSKETIMSYNRGPEGWDTWFSQTDLEALISIWGREDDLGYINYDKESKDYKFRKSGNSFYEIKTEIGYENISHLDSLNFTDKSIKVNEDIIQVFNQVKNKEGITGKIFRLYNAAFGRFPDARGLEYWIEKNLSGVDTYQDTANSFILSNEFADLYEINTDNTSYINSLYSNVLSRKADHEGFNYWLNQIDNGYESKAQLLMGFSESDENKSIFTSQMPYL